MLSISKTEEWNLAHTGGMIGLLELSGVNNMQKSSELDEKKREIEAMLREKYGELSRQEIVSHPVMVAYRAYYKRFRKSYHVLLQVESIAHKGKKLPNVSPLVDANFMAEVETFMLTASHDAEQLCGEIVFDVSQEGDSFIQMRGTEKELLPGDMIMKDEEGISCSILYGQDQRSFIKPETGHVLYVTYAPAAVPREMVELQAEKIETYVRISSPEAVLAQKRILTAE